MAMWMHWRCRSGIDETEFLVDVGTYAYDTENAGGGLLSGHA